MPERLITLAQHFPEKRVLVVGDVMVDEYLWGTVERISPEAPVPVVEFQRQTYVPGGAANVAANILSLRGRPYLGGVVGQDREMKILRDLLGRTLTDGHLINCRDRPTTTKTRIIGSSQQMLRVDREQRANIGESEENALLRWGRKHVASVDCILVSDYAKGVATPRISQGFIRLGRDSGKPVVVDPKGRDFTRYRGATVVTPNVNELKVGTVRLARAGNDLRELARTLISALDGTSVLVTRGADGVSLFRDKGEETHIATSMRRVFDVTGAGDTFAGTLALALAVGANLEEAARIAVDTVLSEAATLQTVRRLRFVLFGTDDLGLYERVLRERQMWCDDVRTELFSSKSAQLEMLFEGSLDALERRVRELMAEQLASQPGGDFESTAPSDRAHARWRPAGGAHTCRPRRALGRPRACWREGRRAALGHDGRERPRRAPQGTQRRGQARQGVDALVERGGSTGLRAACPARRALRGMADLRHHRRQRGRGCRAGLTSTSTTAGCAWTGRWVRSATT
jgi:D-glycero-beta-D-manno-heptose-7-phosphate kinase